MNTPKERVYKLMQGSPLSYTLASRNTESSPLMYFDETKNINRTLRYATNQKSCFEDEQDGNVLLSPIVFVDGLLVVPKNNPVLQQFLHYHPMRDRVFYEVDLVKDAQKEMEELDLESDALIAVRKLSIEEVEMLTRTLFGKDPEKVDTAVLMRDVKVFAKNNPKDFLAAINDPELSFQSKVRVFFDRGLLSPRNNNKEVWFNTPGNKKKMASVAFNNSPFDTAVAYFKSEEGVESLKALESLIQ